MEMAPQNQTFNVALMSNDVPQEIREGIQEPGRQGDKSLKEPIIGGKAGACAKESVERNIPFVVDSILSTPVDANAAVIINDAPSPNPSVVSKSTPISQEQVNVDIIMDTANRGEDVASHMGPKENSQRLDPDFRALKLGQVHQ